MAGAGAEHTTVGGVASRLTAADTAAVPPSEVAVHVKRDSDVSAIPVAGSHPDCELTVDCGSLTLQLTPTLDTYQPFVPVVPVTVGAMTGGEWSNPAGRQSQTPRVDAASEVGLVVMLKLPLGGGDPNPTPPRWGAPSVPVDDVHPLADSLNETWPATLNVQRIALRNEFAGRK